MSIIILIRSVRTASGDMELIADKVQNNKTMNKSIHLVVSLKDFRTMMDQYDCTKYSSQKK